MAADQALAVSYLKTGQDAKAREVVENGIRNSGSFAPQYERMLQDLTSYLQTNRPAGRSP